MTHLRIAVVLSFALVACDSASAPEPTPILVVRVAPEWVSGEAAAGVNQTTRLFRLTFPTPAFVGIPSAESLAVAVAGFYEIALGNAREVFEADRGAPIEFGSLRNCWRPSYAESAYGNIPPEVPGWLRRALSAHWAMPLCGPDGTAQLSVGIPDGPRDVRIENGRLILRSFGGGEDFNGTGVPVRYPQGLPLTPEEAAGAVFAATGKRIVKVPTALNQLDEYGFGQYPLCASWRVTIETPVDMRGETTGQLVHTQEFYVRHAPACFSSTTALFAFMPGQPTTRVFYFPKDTTGHGDFMVVDSASVPIVGPARFQRLSPP